MNRRIFLTELRQAVRNKRTAAVLLIGIAISIVHVFHNIAPNIGIWHDMALNPKTEQQYPYHLFNEWLFFHIVVPFMKIRRKAISGRFIFVHRGRSI